MAYPTEVWAVYPSRQAAESIAARAILRREFKRREWAFEEKATTRINLNGGGRTREILPPAEATRLYRLAHRAYAGLVIFGPTHVFLHPQQQDAIRRKLIARLQTFIEYKCFVELVDNPRQVTEEWADAFADKFASAYTPPECSNEHDPRCLPLHVFQNRGVHALNTAEGRLEFDREHGAAGDRQDSDQRQWRLMPRAFHGYDQLHVAGRQLPRGFHWDVQPGGDSALVITTSQVWVVSRYVNIYPDSHVRGDPPNAKRVV